MIKKLCIRSLQRGVHSMDYIHGLLIMEDDNDSDDDESGDQDNQVAAETDMHQTLAGAAAPVPKPHSPSATTWFKRLECIIMPQEIENKCCG